MKILKFLRGFMCGDFQEMQDQARYLRSKIKDESGLQEGPQQKELFS